MYHKESALGQQHKAHNWEYADAATRAADISVLAADIGKLALQLDNFSLWILQDAAPTWVAAGVADHGYLAGLADDDHTLYALTNPTHAAVTYNASGTSTVTVNGRNEIFSATAATGGTTWAISGAAATGKLSSFTLELTNGGSQTQTWPASVKWDGGTAPTLTAAGLDILCFYTRDGGTTWRGFLAAKDSK
jgi:hypothetical protein